METCLQRALYGNIHGNCIHRCPKTELASVSVHRRMAMFTQWDTVQQQKPVMRMNLKRVQWTSSHTEEDTLCDSTAVGTRIGSILSNVRSQFPWGQDINEDGKQEPCGALKMFCLVTGRWIGRDTSDLCSLLHGKHSSVKIAFQSITDQGEPMRWRNCSVWVTCVCGSEHKTGTPSPAWWLSPQSCLRYDGERDTQYTCSWNVFSEILWKAPF